MELRRRRSDERTEDRQVAQATAAEFFNHASFVTGRADAVGRRRIQPDAKRKQQCLLPGQRSQLVQLAVERKPNTSLRVYFPIDSIAPRASGVSANEIFSGETCAG